MAVAEQLPGQRQAPLAHVLVGRNTDTAFEHASEVVFAQLALGGQFAQRHGLVQVRLNIVADVQALPRREAAGDAGQLPVDLGVVAQHVTKEQGAGAAEGEAVAGVVPVGLQ